MGSFLEINSKQYFKNSTKTFWIHFLKTSEKFCSTRKQSSKRINTEVLKAFLIWKNSAKKIMKK